MELHSRFHGRVQVLTVAASRIDAAASIGFKRAVHRITEPGGAGEGGEAGPSGLGDARAAHSEARRVEAFPSSTGPAGPDADAQRGLSAERIVLDLEAVEFIDSSGLGAIVSVMKQHTPARRVDLAALQPAVANVFRLTRLEEVFVIHPTAQDAVGGAGD